LCRWLAMRMTGCMDDVLSGRRAELCGRLAVGGWLLDGPAVGMAALRVRLCGRRVVGVAGCVGLVVWMAGGLDGVLSGWLAVWGWLCGWLVVWMACCPGGWLCGWPASRVAGLKDGGDKC